MEIDHYYYLVNGQRFVSKNRALLSAHQSGSGVYFYQNDKFWDQQCWSQEPEQSFFDLCQTRCRQLRDSYQWLCLWLSSGYDSQTILRAFVASGCAIDEIAYMNRRQYYDDPELPYIEASIDVYRRTVNNKVKISQINLDSKFTVDFYKQTKDDWIWHAGQNLRASKTTAPLVHAYSDQLKSIKDRCPQGRADIYGKEKPRLDLRDGWWWVQNIDMMWQELGAPIENFYTSEQLPELHIKQCHTVATWFESVPGINHDLVHRIQSNDMAYYREWNLACGRLPVICSHSQHAVNKSDFENKPLNQEGQKLYQYLENNHPEIFLRLVQQPIELRQEINTSHLSRPVFGKSWRLRPFKDVSHVDIQKN